MSILNVHYTPDVKSASKSVIGAKSLPVGRRRAVNYNENMESAARHCRNRVDSPRSTRGAPEIR